MRLARRADVRAITSDAPVTLSGYTLPQRWPIVAGFHGVWNTAAAANAPTIAVIDCGIDADRSDFGWRVLAPVDLAAIQPNAPGDGRGHGTFVAAIAAGEYDGHAGARPNATDRLPRRDGRQGHGATRDVIARRRLDPGATRPSTTSASPTSRCQTGRQRASCTTRSTRPSRLWLNGIVVVAAAGNYARRHGPRACTYAPGNDPFVITVGAADLNRHDDPHDDFAAPWSAYGYTPDGFRSPSSCAPGRFMVDAVPTGSTLTPSTPRNVGRPADDCSSRARRSRLRSSPAAAT